MAPDVLTRRDFLARGGQVGGAAVVLAGLDQRLAAAADAKPAANAPPSEKLVLGFIGTGGQGRFNLGFFLKNPDVEVAAVCDVNKKNLQQAVAQAAASPGAKKPEAHHDFRRVLDRRDIDAVVIGTPDHWHALMTILACQAGKDVYCEKPLSLCVAEGRAMTVAARRAKRVVQTGTQQRSGPHYKEAADVVRSGRLGKISLVRAWNAGNRLPGMGHPPDEQPPADLDWDMWLGPRPKVPYNPVRARGSFRSFWDYSGGTLTDWGTHHMDTIRWIMDARSPITVTASGGKYVIDDIAETPDTLDVVWQFPTSPVGQVPWTLHYSNREASGFTSIGKTYGILFCGTDAALFLDRAGYQIIPETRGGKTLGEPKTVGRPGVENFLPPDLTVHHVRNFLDCVKSRQRPNADVEDGHLSTSLPLLGNVAYHTGRKIRWDGAKEEVIGDPEANQLLTREYRSPWTLPS